MAWNGYSERGQGSMEKGPGTFALDVPGMPRAQARPMATGPVRAGVEGGGARISNNIADNSAALGRISAQPQLPAMSGGVDPTFALLMKAGGARAAEMVKEREEEQFLAGASRVVAGEAMVGIVNEQPWYSQVFGDTALVEGARAYTVKAGVAKWATEHMSRMEELGQNSPDAIPGYLHATMKQVMTGDPGTDRALQAELFAQVPGLVKEHTRQHYLHLQRTAAAAREGAMDNTFQLLGAWQNGSLELDEQGYANLESSLAAVLAPPPGVNEQKHWAAVTERAALAVQGGNVHLFRTLSEQGYLERMPIDAQVKLNQAMRMAAPRALAEVVRTPEFKEQWMALDNAVTEEALVAGIDNLNNLAAGHSGVPREVVEFIPASDELKLRNGLQRSQAAGAQRLAKETARAVGDAMIANAFTEGAAAMESARLAAGLSRSDAEDVLARMIVSAPPNQVLSVIATTAQRGYKVDLAKSMLVDQVSAITGDKVDPGRVKAFFDQYGQLSDEQRLHVGQMLGDEDKAQYLADVHAGLLMNQPPESAVASARLQQRLPREYKAPDKGSLQAAVEKYIDSKKAGWAAETSLTATDIRYASALVGKYARGTARGDNEQRAAVAFKAAEADGAFSIVGTRLVLSTAPEEERSWDLSALARGAGQNHKLVSVEMGRIIDQAGDNLGIDNDERTVIRLPGKPGEAIRYQVIGYRDDKEVTTVVTSDQALASLRALEAEAIRVRDAMNSIDAHQRARDNPLHRSRRVPGYTPQ